jgi:hypothetical protein
MDCRAVLGLTRLLVEQTGADGPPEHRPPNRWISGVNITHYKDMGRSHTVIAMERLALPDWSDLRTGEHADWWLRTVEEHDKALRRLNDGHADEFALLRQYRRTFQSSRQEATAELLEFFSRYAMLVFHKRAAGRWELPRFTLAGVTRILGNDPDLAIALDDAGFRAIAAAVRGSTFGAQTARRYGGPSRREVRFGLLSGFRRAGLTGKPDLLKEVSAFASDFNREGVRRRAAGLPSAHIRPAQLEAFGGIVDRLPSARVAASLLCAVAACAQGAGVEAAVESGRAVTA